MTNDELLIWVASARDRARVTSDDKLLELIRDVHSIVRDGQTFLDRATIERMIVSDKARLQ